MNKGIKRRTYPRNPDYHADAELSTDFFKTVSSSSRYRTYRRIVNEVHQPLQLKLVNGITREKSYLGTYHTVTLREENRLDIIANEEYGDQRYYWVIAMANNIIDPFNVKQGTVLKIPQIATINMKGGYFDV